MSIRGQNNEDNKEFLKNSANKKYKMAKITITDNDPHKNNNARNSKGDSL